MNIELKDLCKDQPEHIEQKIRAAYWLGCAEGLMLAKQPKRKIERTEDNVVYLREL